MKKLTGDEETDIYSRVDYRRMVAWPRRIRREAPFLRQVLSKIPEPSVLDLGCGTGEHCRFLAKEGLRVVGVDRSESMLAKAHQEPIPENLSFICADLSRLDQELEGSFGAAISLGNTLVHITERTEMHAFLDGLRKHLLPEAPFLFQILNYERIFKQGIRYLPLNFRRSETQELIFLRLMEPQPDGRVRFCPTTLKYDPHSDPAVEVVRSKQVELRGWQRPDLVPILKERDFAVESVLGDMKGGPFEAADSNDLVVLARRR